MSFFSLIQRKGVKPIPPQETHIRTVKEPAKPTATPDVQPPRPKTQVAKTKGVSRPVKAQAPKPKTAAAKPHDAWATTIIRPWKAKKPETKAQEVSKPQTKNPADVPRRKSTPPGVNLASALTAVEDTEPQGSAKDVSPAKRKAEENIEAPAKKAKFVSPPPTATPSSAVGAVAGRKPVERAKDVSTNLPQKKKVEETSAAPAKTRCQPATKSFWKNPGYAPDCIVRKVYDTGKRRPVVVKRKTTDSLRVCLGRSFGQSETAAKEGKTESLRDFLQRFAEHCPEYSWCLCDNEKVSRRDMDNDFKATTPTVSLLRQRDNS
ncbi:MAG: hypothetical protein Q9201_004585 [Fulgogasparrea decipioides]